VLQVVEESRRNVSHYAPRQVRRDAMLHTRSRRLRHRSRPKQIRLQVLVEVGLMVRKNLYEELIPSEPGGYRVGRSNERV
jgi:hypothetical protein